MVSLIFKNRFPFLSRRLTVSLRIPLWDESSVSNDDAPVIPTQLKVTHQILSHWEQRDLKVRFTDSRRDEQLNL